MIAVEFKREALAYVLFRSSDLKRVVLLGESWCVDLFEVRC